MKQKWFQMAKIYQKNIDLMWFHEFFQIKLPFPVIARK